MAKYRITSNRKYMGYAPGEVMVADLAPEVELRALALGAIERLDAKPEKVDKTKISRPKARALGAPEPADEAA